METNLPVKVGALKNKTRQRRCGVDREREECGNWSLHGGTDLVCERKQGQERGRSQEAVCSVQHGWFQGNQPVWDSRLLGPWETDRQGRSERSGR